MSERTPLPAGAYVTVRAIALEWAAIIALDGTILSKAVFSDRAQAFSTAIGKAEREGLPCLVRRVGA